MRHFLDFEKPIAELEGKIEELRRMSEPDGINIAEEVARLTDKGPPASRDLCQADAVAEDPSRPSPGSAEGPDLHRVPHHRVHALGGGSGLCRRCGGDRRNGSVPGPRGGGAGDREGCRYRDPS